MSPRRAAISFEGPEALVLRRALEPEAGRDLPKARVSLSGGPRRLTITIDAEDTSSLRAAVNSYLRWAEVAARVREEVHG